MLANLPEPCGKGVYWSSKKQTSVESLSLRSEFVAMKQCHGNVQGLHYKLQMLGIPCENSTCSYGDSQSVLAIMTVPDSMLRKKSQSIPYHFVHEGSVHDEWHMTYINTHENKADLLMKQGSCM